MSRQQALSDEIRRARHNNLVWELRLCQRNIVFPDTVRNEGAFYRNLASRNVHAFKSHRIFAALFGLFMLLGFLLIPAVAGAIKAILSFQDFGWIIDLTWIVGSLLWIAIGLKIAVNAMAGEDPKPRPQLPKTYPHVKI